MSVIARLKNERYLDDRVVNLAVQTHNFENTLMILWS